MVEGQPRRRLDGGVVIFTAEYLAAAPHATLEIVFPDGAVWRTRALADGNGVLVGGVRAAIAWERGGAASVDCSRNLDRLRRAHAAALARDPARTLSQWAQGQ